MISRDEPMALVLQRTRHHNVLLICYLGYATLDGNEMHRIEQLANRHGCYAYTTVCLSAVQEGKPAYDSLYKEVEKALT